MTTRLLLFSLFSCWLAFGAIDNAIAQESPAPVARAAGVTVSGRVVDGYPGAMPQPEVVLFTRMDGPPSRPPVTTRLEVGPDRTFTAAGVAPGEYTLQALGSFDTKWIVVGADDISGIDVIVSGQSHLQPTVRVDDGSAVPEPVMVRIFFGPGRSQYRSLLDPAGFVLPPGERWLFVVAPDGYFVQSMASAGVDLLRSPIDIQPGAAPRGIDVVLTRGKPADAPTVSVVGTVRGHAGLDVELVETTSGRRTIVDVTTTDGDGGFRFDGLPRGVYAIDLPPAERVVNEIQSGAGESRVDISVPTGGRIFAGAFVPIHTGQMRMVPIRPSRLSLVAERDGIRTSIPIEFTGYWGALEPGAYRLSVEGLQPGYSVRVLTAGSVNLLEEPFIVPADRAAEIVRLELNYVASE